MAGEKITQVWPEWVAEKTLGKGSYGTVYKAVRSGNNIVSQAAIKVISIPADSAELDSLRSEGLTEESAKTYFRGIVDDFVGEIQMMEVMKGVQNIVSVEDYKVVEKTDEIGWDIYIRMELLTPFNTYLCNHRMTEKDVIRLGIDICTALEICEKCSVIHRDIKPENIFINDFGYFKLGDFGIAKKLENATGNMSQKGTYNYMAPEIAAGRNYDVRVDIYSLGIVLYRLLNQNRLPFIENEQQLLNANARKEAVERRLRGERMQPPCEASKAVADVIMQACAFRAEDRFASAAEMKRALNLADLGMDTVLSAGAVSAEDDMDKTYRVRPAMETIDGTIGAKPPVAPAPERKSAAPAAPGKLIMNFGKGKKAPAAASAPTPAAPEPARMPVSVTEDKSVGSSMSGGFNGWHQATPLMSSTPKPTAAPVFEIELSGDIPAPMVDSIPRKEKKSPFGNWKEDK